jgi:hypothetical protein
MARGVTTEWNDIQERMGGYTKLEREPTAEDVHVHNVDISQYYDRRNGLSHQERVEEGEDDADYQEDEVVKSLMAARLQEMKAKASQRRFGKVYELNKPDWEAHVTNAPKDISCLILLT